MSDNASKLSVALTAIDLFCGAGGLSEGFRQAGFNIAAGNDIDIAAGETFAATHPPRPIRRRLFFRVLSKRFSHAIFCVLEG